MVASTLQDVFEISAKTISLSLPAYKPHKTEISYSDEKEIKNEYEGKLPVLPFAESGIFNAKITNYRCLVEQGNNLKAVYEITFDIEGSNFKFNPGDTIGVIPHNKDDEVQYLLHHLHITEKANCLYFLNVDKSVKFKIPQHIPIKSSLAHVFKYCVDLRGVIKKLLLLALAEYTENIYEKRTLEYLCSKEGAAMYTKHVLNNNLCIIDIFRIFKSCKPPVEVLLENLPRLLPRPYSIVNSMNKKKNVLKICFSVMILENSKKGLTTEWLESLILNNNRNLDLIFDKLTLNDEFKGCNVKVPIYLRKNMGFSLPSDHKLPLLLIGPGTGISPYIGFLEERLYSKECDPKLHLGETRLFFGCKNPETDFIYKEELNLFRENGVLTQLSVSFSRDENGGKKYVQDAIKSDAEEIVKFIKEGAIIFVCGDYKKMAAQVRECIVECFIQTQNLIQEDAEKIVAQLEEDKRYLVDLWS